MAERALKSSLRNELVYKSTQQALFEDFLCSNANNGVVSCDDFSVDCFFDFSNGECYIQEKNMLEVEEEEEEEEEEKDSLSDSYQDRVDDDNNSNFSTTFSNSLLSGELSVPVDDLAELEWVSQIMDDSSSEFSLLCPLKPENLSNRFQPQPEPANFIKTSCLFPAPIPSKPRSKRSRARTWCIGSPISDLSPSSPSSSSSPASSSASTPCIVLTNMVQSIDSILTEPPMKKLKKKPELQTGEAFGSTQFQRRCSHCLVQKTPQWRTGPLGAKTLCNACGVRYKSGRLFPEYRPACSPTFSADVHSNSHRKVLEIRKKKEIVVPEYGMVPNF